MNDDVQNIDDLFRSALEQNEEMPSPAVKESLNAMLDKQDAASYKRKYAAWKRVAIILLVLLTGFILYESGTFEMLHQKETTKNAANNNVINKNGEMGNNAIAPNGNLIKRQPPIKITGFNTDTTTKNQKSLPHIAGQKTGWANRKEKIVPGNNQTGIRVTSSKHDKNSNGKLKYYESISKEKINLVASNEKNGAGLIDSIRQIHSPAISYSLFENSVTKNKKQNKASNFKPYWSITGAASYEQVNYKLDSDLPNAITNIRHREAHEPSFSIGLLAARQLKKHWGLQTGLTYSYTAIGISPQKIYAFQNPAGGTAYKYITSSGYAYIKPGLGAIPAVGDSLNTAEAKHTLHSISVPLIIKYSVEKNKFSFRPGVGIEANLLTGAKVEVEIEDTPNREIVFINKLNGAKSFYWSITSEAELQYSVNKRFSLTLRPAFRYALSPITEDNVVETFPYSFGLGMGMTYKFR